MRIIEPHETIQQDLEAEFYEKLSPTTLAKDVLTGYPQQSIEELAGVLTEGMMLSWIGDIIARQAKTFAEATGIDWKAICKTAFRAAVLRLLKEATENESKKGE